MKYCKKCIIPDTRPNSSFGSNGVCDACKSHSTRRDVDWEWREDAFRHVVENAKQSSKGYDCVIPVSGGKDSHWQVIKCLDYGLNPLAVTWKSPGRTEIGRKNLENLVSLGVDHIDYQVNPNVERKFVYKALTRFGTTAIPMHMALFNIPLKIAIKFDIPLVVWGENSAYEYGSEQEALKGFKMDTSWLRRFGVNHDTTAHDWVDDDLTLKEMTPYIGPSNEELEAKGILAVFLGYYFPWDPENSLKAARTHGFRARDEGPKTGYYNYADIDDDFISIHHFIKWHKFGFTRSYDNLSLEIRNGRLTRDQAIEILRQRGYETPQEDIEKFCEFLGINREHFFGICDGFRNPDIWTRREGKWILDDFLIPDWEWE